MGKVIINYSPLLTHPLLPKSSIESIQQEIQDASSHEELLSNHSIDHSVMGAFRSTTDVKNDLGTCL